jgi:hypothetical protein
MPTTRSVQRACGLTRCTRAGARNAARPGSEALPVSPGTAAEAALAFAMAGDAAQAESLVQDLSMRFPLHPEMQSLWLPAIQSNSSSIRGVPLLC